MDTANEQTRLPTDQQAPTSIHSSVIVRVVIAFVLGTAAMSFLLWSMTVPRGWGGGMGVPSAILQPIVFFLAAGTVILACILGAVSILIALLRPNPGGGSAAILLSIIAVLASAGQYLFWIFGPDV